MKWIFVLGLFGMLPQWSLAQSIQNEKVIFLNENGQPAKEKKAAFQRQIIQVDDTLWEYNLYRKNGPRISSIRTSDADGKIRNGRFIAYSAGGRIDSVGHYARGLRTGDWSYYTYSGRLLQRRHYDHGVLIWTKDSATVRHEMDSAKTARDSLRIAGDTDAVFPGGGVGWLHYLNKVLRYPDDAVNNMIMGTVEVAFFVDTVGHIPEKDAWIYRSVSLSIDQAALWIMVNSPAWTPATYRGRLTGSSNLQPIVFKLEVQ